MIPPKTFKALFQDFLTPEILSKIIACVFDFFIPYVISTSNGSIGITNTSSFYFRNGEYKRTFNIMNRLVGISRFDMVYMFLDEHEKQKTHNILDTLNEKLSSDLKTKVESLRSSYQ